jgi:hypothetical protein
MKTTFDEFDENALSKINKRRSEKTPYEQLFEELYDIALSPVEARKQLRGIEQHLINKQEARDEQIEDTQVGGIENIQKIKYKESVEIQDAKQISDRLIKMS